MATGDRSRVVNHFRGLSLEMGLEIPLLVLKARAYDEGVAFRLVFLSPRVSPLLLFPGNAVISLVVEATVAFPASASGRVFQDLGGEGGVEVHQLADEVGRNPWAWDLPMHPLTIEFNTGLLLSITEARNLEFGSLRFRATPTTTSSARSFSFRTLLASFLWQDVLPETNLDTPWLTFMVARSLGALLEGAHLVQNLTDPMALGDTSWITPGPELRVTDFTTVGCKWAIDSAARLNFSHISLAPGWYGPENSRFSVPQNFAVASPQGPPLDIWLSPPSASSAPPPAPSFLRPRARTMSLACARP